MSISKYPIKRWDAVMGGNSLVQYPAFYIEPDLSFLEFARVNEYKLVCKITGTGIYDTAPDYMGLIGVVNNSRQLTNCRPNFFAQTGAVIVTLNMDWREYPDQVKLGYVEFFGSTM